MKSIIDITTFNFENNVCVNPIQKELLNTDKYKAYALFSKCGDKYNVGFRYQAPDDSFIAECISYRGFKTFSQVIKYLIDDSIWFAQSFWQKHSEPYSNLTKQLMNNVKKLDSVQLNLFD